MARAATTPEQWAEAKRLWESSAAVSYAAIGEQLGISKQAVAKKAKADKWQKHASVEEKADRAQELADRITARETLPKARNAVNRGSEASRVDAAPAEIQGDSAARPGVEHVDAEPVDGRRPPALPGLGDEPSVEQMAEIIRRHRMEVRAPLALAYDAIKNKDYNKARVAKASAETMKIVHELERKAWGLDRLQPGDGPPTVVLERG